ncbi:MAG TPA: glycosyltransferase family 2 protein [Polyangia bacterium]|nr:glycosyltransferase family 2 protein [Polyangia bacterium]
MLLVALALIGYAYVGYPALMFLRARFRPRPIRRAPIRPNVTIVIAAWNEAKTILHKLQDLAQQSYPAELTEVIVACDGSSDGTPLIAERARSLYGERLHVVRIAQHSGKATALNAAMRRAGGEIVVFTDARQDLTHNAVAALVDNFADPEVGAAGGELVLAGDAPAGVYWRYEAALRKWESAAGSTIGVSGALYALRRELWKPLPEETILDDVLVPMRARLAGRRVVLEPLAKAFDVAGESSREFMRKVRTLSGNFQLLALEPRLLSPLANPSWFGLMSHKLMRLAVPYAMLTAFVASALLPEPFRAIFLGAQLIAYGLAMARWLGGGQASRLAKLCETMVVLNAAAVVGTFRFLRHGRRLQW